jgi:hypothetical protein
MPDLRLGAFDVAGPRGRATVFRGPKPTTDLANLAAVDDGELPALRARCQCPVPSSDFLCKRGNTARPCDNLMVGEGPPESPQARPRAAAEWILVDGRVGSLLRVQAALQLLCHADSPIGQLDSEVAVLRSRWIEPRWHDVDISRGASALTKHYVAVVVAKGRDECSNYFIRCI